jgi:hypothetical protein
MRMVSSGILTMVRITIDKEKRRYVLYFHVFSLRFESPSVKRNEDAYGIFRNDIMLNYITNLSIP